jgi:hypothetical protein
LRLAFGHQQGGDGKRGRNNDETNAKDFAPDRKRGRAFVNDHQRHRDQ